MSCAFIGAVTLTCRVGRYARNDRGTSAPHSGAVVCDVQHRMHLSSERGPPFMASTLSVELTKSNFQPALPQLAFNSCFAEHIAAGTRLWPSVEHARLFCLFRGPMTPTGNEPSIQLATG